MAFSGVRAVLFDFGNTLIEFNRPQIKACDTALSAELQRLFGPLDSDRFAALRNEDRLAPYAGDPPRYRENDLRTISIRHVRALYDTDPTADQVDRLVAARRQAFVEVVTAGEGAHQVLESLSSSYRIALVSNYPCSDSIRISAERLGLARYFETIVVSAEVGRVKPHPAPFVAALQALDVSPEQAVYVGDNWLADVQGPKRLGMRAIWTRQYAPAEWFEPAPTDHPADGTLTHLRELPALLEPRRD